MNEYFYGEAVIYENEEEKEEAKTYLMLWKKFLLKNIRPLEFVDESWVDRSENFTNNMLGDRLWSPNTLALKIKVQGTQRQPSYPSIKEC